MQEGEALEPDQLTLERIMLGLRTSEGLPESFLRANCDSDALSRALAAGHLVSAAPIGDSSPAQPAEQNLRIPESYFFISDSIIASLV